MIRFEIHRRALGAILAAIASAGSLGGAPTVQPTTTFVAAEERDGRILVGLQADYALYPVNRLLETFQEGKGKAPARPASSVASLVSWESIHDIVGDRASQAALHVDGGWAAQVRQLGPSPLAGPAQRQQLAASSLKARLSVGAFDIVLTERRGAGGAVVPRPIPVRLDGATRRIAQAEIPLSSAVYNAYTLLPELDPRGRSRRVEPGKLAGLDRFEIQLTPPAGEGPAQIEFLPEASGKAPTGTAAGRLVVFANVRSDAAAGYGKTARQLAQQSGTPEAMLAGLVLAANDASSVDQIARVWHPDETPKIKAAQRYFQATGMTQAEALQQAAFVAARNAVPDGSRLLASIDAGIGTIAFWVTPAAGESLGAIVDVAVVPAAGRRVLADNFVVLGDQEGLTYQLFWSAEFKTALLELIRQRDPQVIERLRAAGSQP